MKLEFPIIIYIDNVLSVYPEEAIKVNKISFPDARTTLCMESVKNTKAGWIIDFNGRYRQLKPQGKRREWTRPLSFLWQFVLSEYSMSKSRTIAVSELKILINDINDSYPEAPITEDLRKFLMQYEDSVIVSKELLRKWPI